MARKPKPPAVRASITAVPSAVVPPADVTLTWSAGSAVVKPYTLRIEGPGVAEEPAVMASGSMSFRCESVGLYRFSLVNGSGYVVAICSVNAADGS